MEHCLFPLQEKLSQYPISITAETIKQLSHEIADLEYENTLLRLIFASASDPILITDKQVRIIYVNPAWEALTGYNFDEVKDKSPRMLQSGKTPKRVYKAMWKALSNNKAFTTEEAIDKRKNGSEYQFHSTFFPVSKDGITVYYVQIQHDITKRKQLEELRKEFLSAAAHELKTPLTVLKLISQSNIAKVKKQGNHGISVRDLERIDKEIDRITQMINDMSDSSRFETGKLFLNLEATNISNLIKDTITKMRIYINDHTLIFSNLPETLPVLIDPNRIEQVLVNLLTNAAKYSPQNSTITVTTEIQKNMVVIAVKDEGIGIPKEKQKYIFNKYYQVKEQEGKGFGLGLYISKEIMKRHKGKIWIQSNKGKGSTFFISLPLYYEK